jgi:hypothetical protein
VILDRQGRQTARLHGDAAWHSPSARQILQRVIELTRATHPTIRT